MRHIRRIMYVLALVLCFALFACGKKTDTKPTDTKPTSSDDNTKTDTTPAEGWSFQIKSNYDGAVVHTDKNLYNYGDTVTLTADSDSEYDCVGFVTCNSTTFDYRDLEYVLSYTNTFTFTFGEKYGFGPAVVNRIFAIYAPKGGKCVLTIYNEDVSVSTAGMFSKNVIGITVYGLSKKENRVLDYYYDFYETWTEGKITPCYDSCFDVPMNQSKMIVFNTVPKDGETVKITLVNSNEEAGTVYQSAKFCQKNGSGIELKATPNPGYEFDGWYEGDYLWSNEPTWYDLMIFEWDITIVAKWNPVSVTTYTLTTTNDNSSYGTCTIYTDQQFEAGSSVTLTATPASGYVFDGWYNGTTKVSGSTNYTFNINSNLTLVAKWIVASEDKYILSTVNSYSNAGSITNYTNQEFDKNASVTLTATKNTGYKFDGWYNGSTKVSSDSNYTFNINSNLTLTAKWKIYISAYANTPIGGTCSDFEDNEYDPNESLTLTATTNPETGYTFDGWYEWSYVSGECLGRVSENEVYTFNVTKPAVYQANWVEYTVTTKPCYNSSNDLTDSLDYYYVGGDFTTLDGQRITTGQTVTLTATPREHSVTWVGWYKQTGSYPNYTYTLLSTSETYNYTMTKETVTIVAKFLLYKVLGTDSENNPTVIEYGFYPQTLVDDDIKTQLASYVDELPTEDDSKTWTSYGYYDDDVVSNYMWYKDIDINNDGFMDYRGVYFTKYRGGTISSTAYSSGSAITNNDIYKNGYRSGEVYWFSYDAIVWDIVDDAGAGDKRIVSRYVLDAQEWYLNSADRPDGLNTIYANNYKYSSIREWLNKDNGFYYTVFDIFRQKNNTLNATDNSLASTGKTSNDYVCEDTVDKVYLLSTKEFNNYLKNTSIKQGRPTAYAQIQGAYVQDGTGSSAGYSVYYLRTPNTSKTSCIYVGTGGGTGQNGVSNIQGIRPAIDMML